MSVFLSPPCNAYHGHISQVYHTLATDTCDFISFFIEAPTWRYVGYILILKVLFSYLMGRKDLQLAPECLHTDQCLIDIPC